MSAISRTFLIEIEKRLTTNSFLSEDFIITSESEEQDNAVSVKIKYLYIPDYYFVVYISGNGSNFEVEYCPGMIIKKEITECKNTYNFYSTLDKWLFNIEKEMQASPIVRKLMEHEDILKQFQEKIHQMENADNYFSTVEQDDYLQRLDKLEEAFTKKLEEDIQENDELSEQIAKLNSEINTLKTQLDALSKKNWFLSLSTRLFTWYKRNPSAARQLAGFTRELLPQEAKDAVSQEALDQLLLPVDSTAKQTVE
ncbi:hypothetical protein SAMN05444673_2570 [Bacillus sp. OV166]|uniref:MbeD/MobD family mobilization/exclusion protein n=1 Tax=Bacillus sp. OV166 TaxID=1882763 RepID=UPI000A2ACAD9|nr:MbeD/MobD family mobilization/exclusion protein [Bacillus sp. OV166]SMQ75926.1 hypothetical protein SAMN05444673_2570 [Bacillus sp. OV166]